MILALLTAVSLAGAPATGCPQTAGAQADVCRAVAATAGSRFAEAGEAFDRAAAASPPGEPRTQRMLAAAGNAWIAAGQPGKAALSLDRALAGNGLLADQRGLALLDRARAAEAQGDLASARRFADLAAQSAGEDPFTWYFSAALGIREGNLAVARSSINRALALANNDPDILFEAGHVAEAEGDAARARQYWGQAVAADPASPGGRAAQQALGLIDTPPAGPKSVTTTTTKEKK